MNINNNNTLFYKIIKNEINKDISLSNLIIKYKY